MNATAQRQGPGTFPAPGPSAGAGSAGHDFVAEREASDTARSRAKIAISRVVSTNF
jgi:hypothetical protein